ncbi:unnamed protein product, partial [Rhizoctonia solani]
MPGAFSCVEACKQGPFTLKGLTLHRKACSAWQNEIGALSLSCSSSEESNTEQPATKRRRLEEMDMSQDDNSSINPLRDEPVVNDTSILAPGDTVTAAPAIPVPRPFTRSQARNIHVGYRQEHDMLPEGPPQLSMPNVIPTSNPVLPAKTQPRHQAFRTEPDVFGRYRVYPAKPLVIPDAGSPMAHVLPASIRDRNSWLDTTADIAQIIAPCPNLSVFYVMRYHWLTGETKSLANRDYLCSEVLLQPDFNRDDLININFKDIDDKLAAAAHNWDPSFPLSEGWKNIPLCLPVPPPRITQRNRANPPSPSYISINGFRALTLLSVMRKAFSKNDQKSFHYEPFEEYYKPPGSLDPPQRLSGEMYTSPAMVRAHQEVQHLVIEDKSCTLPRCVAAYMFASDSVQFASFSRLKGWPILCSFGNQSKYEQCKPTSNTCFQLAHIPSARYLIYNEGQSVQSKAVEELLKDNSYVPVMNAFSFKLGDLGFNIFGSLVVDQLHEVELGVWKAVFKHLIRLLHLSGNSAVVEFNKRFRSVPSFSSTICSFAEDVAEMGRIAARDYEDILQCCIPVFEGLLPASCEIAAQRLLFVFATWHGLAKLRLHTRDTLRVFKLLTTQLGDALRHFAHLTKDLEVRETPKEYARRRKQIEAAKALTMTRRARHSKQPSTRPTDHTIAANSNELSSDGRHLCKLNLDTYKAHSFPDYPRTIEEYGTTDSYSTQINELQNRKIKGQYTRTNHRNVVEQMTRVGDITAVLEDIDVQLKQVRAKALEGPLVETDTGTIDSLLDGAPYSIGLKERSEDAIRGIPQWVASHQDDDATKFFIPQLKQHLLARILGTRNHPNFSDSELIHLRFYQDCMWRHKTLGINYTSYDVLRQQDPLNPSTSNRFVMLASDPSSNSESPSHPFVYAKILGIYHTKVIYKGQRPERLNFVHVRWLYYDFDRPGGWDNQRLDCLGYLTCLTDEDILDSFDFIDPDDIIRACHLI